MVDDGDGDDDEPSTAFFCKSLSTTDVNDAFLVVFPNNDFNVEPADDDNPPPLVTDVDDCEANTDCDCDNDDDNNDEAVDDD